MNFCLSEDTLCPVCQCPIGLTEQGRFSIGLKLLWAKRQALREEYARTRTCPVCHYHHDVSLGPISSRLPSEDLLFGTAAHANSR